MTSFDHMVRALLVGITMTFFLQTMHGLEAFRLNTDRMAVYLFLTGMILVSAMIAMEVTGQAVGFIKSLTVRSSHSIWTWGI